MAGYHGVTRTGTDGLYVANVMKPAPSAEVEGQCGKKGKVKLGEFKSKVSAAVAWDVARHLYNYIRRANSTEFNFSEASQALLMSFIKGYSDVADHQVPSVARTIGTCLDTFLGQTNKHKFPIFSNAIELRVRNCFRIFLDEPNASDVPSLPVFLEASNNPPPSPPPTTRSGRHRGDADATGNTIVVAGDGGDHSTDFPTRGRGRGRGRSRSRGRGDVARQIVPAEHPPRAEEGDGDGGGANDDKTGPADALQSPDDNAGGRGRGRARGRRGRGRGIGLSDPQPERLDGDALCDEQDMGEATGQATVESGEVRGPPRRKGVISNEGRNDDEVGKISEVAEGTVPRRRQYQPTVPTGYTGTRPEESTADGQGPVNRDNIDGPYLIVEVITECKHQKRRSKYYHFVHDCPCDAKDSMMNCVDFLVANLDHRNLHNRGWEQRVPRCFWERIAALTGRSYGGGLVPSSAGPWGNDQGPQ